MLRTHLLKGIAAGLAALMMASSVQAQGLTVESMGTTLSKEGRQKFEELARGLQAEAIKGAQDPRAQQQAAQVARRADAIANPEMAKEREKVMRFLGIDPESEHALFIFVSWSMPLDMLRAYAVEAMWTGATLVFRGVPPGRTLPDFLIQDLRQLVWDKGASAAISIDPRLYDSYSIKVVPTMVLTRTRENFTCIEAGTRTVMENGKSGSYPLCPPIDPKLFVKLSGSVTLDYALETFEKEGFDEAEVYLAALRRGYPVGQGAGKEQRAFKGEWKDAVTPQQLMQQHQLEEQARKKQQEQVAAPQH